MGLVLKDRVKDTTATIGTGTITLSGTAPQGYQSFTVIGNGNTTYYTIAGPSEWEVGIGTYNSGTLARTTVLESSNSNSLVDFSAGDKNVFVSLPAEMTANTVRLAAFFFLNTPPAGQVLMLYTATETLTFEDDFAGSYGRCDTNPTASFVMGVQKNGVAVGTVTVSTSGVFTFATTSGALSLAPGDQLKVIGPNPADASIANTSISFRGTY